MAGRFPIYTDADLYGPLVDALRTKGWDVVRAIDVFPERTRDPIHFDEAVRRGRVLVSNDSDMRVIAERWLREGRPFPGLVTWAQHLRFRYSVGALLAAFEALAAREDPFGPYPIRFLTPTR